MKRTSLVIVFVLLMASFSFAQDVKYQLSSHILDITSGKPAAGVKITLSKQVQEKTWIVLEEKTTDTNGRITDFLKQDVNHKGIYKLTYYTNPYFKKNSQNSFYPFIEVVFELTDNEHYHVPITLSPFGYSTYRGN